MLSDGVCLIVNNIPASELRPSPILCLMRSLSKTHQMTRDMQTYSRIVERVVMGLLVVELDSLARTTYVSENFPGLEGSLLADLKVEIEETFTSPPTMVISAEVTFSTTTLAHFPSTAFSFSASVGYRRISRTATMGSMRSPKCYRPRRPNTG